jgi:hypothetical protein
MAREDEGAMIESKEKSGTTRKEAKKYLTKAKKKGGPRKVYIGTSYS